MGGSATGATLEEAHVSLEALTLAALRAGHIPFCIGGDNSQSYCHASAWLAHRADTTGYTSSDGMGGLVVNLDAHLDVRPYLEGGLRHSGSPFYALLEDARFQGKLVEFAAQGAQCSAAHVKYVVDKGGEVKWLGGLRRSGGSAADDFVQVLGPVSNQSIFVSFDLDSIAGRDMPGVSCPSPVGLSSEEAIQIGLEAGKHPGVNLMDMSELNVGVEADRSPRLAVMIIYHFLLGLAQRH